MKYGLEHIDPLQFVTWQNTIKMNYLKDETHSCTHTMRNNTHEGCSTLKSYALHTISMALFCHCLSFAFKQMATYLFYQWYCTLQKFGAIWKTLRFFSLKLFCFGMQSTVMAFIWQIKILRTLERPKILYLRRCSWCTSQTEN